MIRLRDTCTRLSAICSSDLVLQDHVTTPPRGAVAATRLTDGCGVGQSVRAVPSSNSAPPVQIQLTSGLTKIARLTCAVGPSPSQLAKTTYRSHPVTGTTLFAPSTVPLGAHR